MSNINAQRIGECPITDFRATFEPRTGDKEKITVEAAGISYAISGSALADENIGQLLEEEDNRLKLRRKIYERNQKGDEFPLLTVSEIKNIYKQPMPSLKQRFDWFLENFYATYALKKELQDEKEEWLELICTAACISRNNLGDFFSTAINDGLIDLSNTSKYRLTVKGAAFIEETKTQKSSSEEVFVAMWFDDQMNPYFEAIKNKVERATDLKLIRIDKQDFNGKIDDEIIARLRSCRLVIADFTEEMLARKHGAAFIMKRVLLTASAKKLYLPLGKTA